MFEVGICLSENAGGIHTNCYYVQANERQLSHLFPFSSGTGNVMPGIEFNFYVDPEASFIVFDSVNAADNDINPIVLLPWESVVKRNTISMVS
jgi:hypothetical protein